MAKGILARFPRLWLCPSVGRQTLGPEAMTQPKFRWDVPASESVMPRSVHDNFVLGYSVDAEAGTLLIRTEYRDGEGPFERTDVHFEGVIGYMFRDNLGGVLFDITEDSMDQLLEDFSADFEWGTRYCWPWAAAGAELDPRDYVAAMGGHAYRVHSAIGFDGFVIAQSMTLEPAD